MNNMNPIAHPSKSPPPNMVASGLEPTHSQHQYRYKRKRSTRGRKRSPTFLNARTKREARRTRRRLSEAYPAAAVLCFNSALSVSNTSKENP